MAFQEFDIITNNSLLLKTAIAGTIFVIGLILGRILGKAAEKITRKLKIFDLFNSRTKKKFPFARIIRSIVSYTIYFLTTIMALNQLGIATTILNIISGTFMILIVVFAFLGLKDFIPNITAGLFLISKRTIQEGDTIKFNNVEGKIEYLGTVETKIITKDGDEIIVPNQKLTQYEIIVRKNSDNNKKE